MASTYSDLKIELIGTGEQTGTWGATTNNNFSIAVGEAITGSANVAFSSVDVTLTLTDTNAAQTARNLRLNLTGTSGGARQLILGSGCQIEKLYLVNNGLADAVTVKNTSGTGIVVPAGKSLFVFNDGTNVVEATNAMISLAVTGNAAVGGNLAVTGNSTVGGNLAVTGTSAFTGVSTFASDSTYTGTGQIRIPNGTTEQRSATPAVGSIRYNITLQTFEGYLTFNGQAISTITNVTTVATLTTAINHGLTTGTFITVSGATPDAYNGIFSITVVDATSFTYTMLIDPEESATVVGSYEVGEWGGIGGGAEAGGAVYENRNSITENYTMTTNYNGESVSPLTIGPGVAITIPAGSRWVVL
jgi:hypothetical protein